MSVIDFVDRGSGSVRLSGQLVVEAITSLALVVAGSDGKLSAVNSAGTTTAPLSFTGVPYFGNANRLGAGDLVVMDDNNNTAGVIEWQNNATNSGEMVHLTGGVNNTGSGGSGPVMLAIAVNYGGVGGFINNYRTGVGLKITNRSTVSNAAAWGLLVSQNSTASEGVYLSQETNTALMPLKVVSAPIGSIGGAGAAAGQVLAGFYRSQAATADTPLWVQAVDSVTSYLPLGLKRVTAPGANLALGALIYCDNADGIVKIRGTAGTITNIGPA